MFLLFFIATLGIMLLVILALMRYVLLVVTVENISMTPTLEPGDRLLAARHWPVRWLRKGHIVLIDPWPATLTGATFFATMLYIKRIVALGGETFTPSHNDITTNSSFSEKADNEQNHWYVPAGHFFAQGDGPRSIDSRQWGALPLRSVRAVALMKLPRNTRPRPPQHMPSFGLPVGESTLFLRRQPSVLSMNRATSKQADCLAQTWKG